MMNMKLLVIGTGFGATWLDAARASSNWEIAGAVATTEKSLDEAGKKFDIQEDCLYTDVGKALERCEADAVVVAVPNHLHHEIARRVVDAKKHLILEKPITETWEQAVSLLRSVENAGVRACVGQTLRGEFFLRMMSHFLGKGVIGKVEQLTFESHWLWTSSDPGSKRQWRFQLPDMFLDDIGIHQIDTIRMLLGNAKCKELVGRTFTPASYPHDINVTASGIWNMEDHVHVNYFGSMGARGHDVGWYGRINVFGEKGCLFREPTGQPYLYMDGKKEPVGLDDEHGDDVDEFMYLVEHEKIAFLLEDFYLAITEGRPPVTDLNDNLNSHAILLAMKESARNRVTVNVQEAFPRP